MPKFSNISKQRLAECDERLQKLFNEVIKVYDCAITCGHRGEKEQNGAYESGNSKLKYPHSKHNKIPSQAIDVIPFPIDWKDYDRFEELSNIVKAKAIELDINIDCGIDWKFKDMPHYELI